VSSGTDDPSLMEDVHEVRLDVVEDSVVVRDEEYRRWRIGLLHNRIYTTSDDSKCIDIEAGISFIENRELRLEQSHLKDLVAFTNRVAKE
jgi:hypothetical protein